jgi:hypothetical protein
MALWPMKINLNNFSLQAGCKNKANGQALWYSQKFADKLLKNLLLILHLPAPLQFELKMNY